MSKLKSNSIMACFQDNSRELLLALQDLYDSEINYSIETFWDGGFTVKLGDEMNGFVSSGSFDTFNECVYWLADESIKMFPNSTFAKNYTA